MNSVTDLVILSNKLILNPLSPQVINAKIKRINIKVNPTTKGHTLCEEPSFSGIK